MGAAAALAVAAALGGAGLAIPVASGRTGPPPTNSTPTTTGGLGTTTAPATSTSTTAAIRPAARKPSAGTWRIGIYTNRAAQPRHSTRELAGSFKLIRGARALGGLTATVQKGVSSRCHAGTRVTLVGTTPVRRFLRTASNSEYYYVGGARNATAPAAVKLAFRRGRGAVHRGSAKLHIVFPGGGGIDAVRTAPSTLKFANRWGGTCSLQFSVSR